MENFLKIDGEIFIDKEYRKKRLKELTTEKNNIESKINELKNELHDVNHFIQLTKNMKIIPKSSNKNDNKNY